jgi:hypothetical protein
LLADQPTRFINDRNLSELAMNIEADKMLELHVRLHKRNDKSAGYFLLLAFSR